MFIERIGVNQFQRHLMPASLSFADRGVTLVAGPNESGKSTMFRALREAFLRNASSSASVVKKFQPWYGDGELAPSVTVDFFFKKKYYRLVKSWGARKEALLYEYPTAERRNDEARLKGDPDAFLADIFAAKTGSTTALTAPQLGLMHLLFTPQGRVRLDDTEGLGDAARLRLADVIGVAAESDEETKVVQKLKRAYDEVYTGKGRLKAGASSNGIAREVGRIEAALAEARQEAAAIERLRAELDEALQCVAVSSGRYDVAKQRKDRDLPELFKAQRVKNQLDRAHAELEARTREYDDLIAAAKMIEDLQAESDKCRERLAAEEQRAGEATAAADAAEQRYAAATAAMNRAAGEDPEVMRLQGEYDRVAQALRQQSERDRLAEDLAHVDQADAEIATLAAQLAQTVAVSRDVVERAQALHAEITPLIARIEAAQLVLSVTASARFEATVTTTAGSTDVALATGESTVLRSDGTLNVTLPNARIEVRGPVADMSADKQRMESLRQSLAEIEAEFGTGDPVALAQAAERRTEVERRFGEFQERREALLKGGAVEELRARLDQLHASLDGSPVGEQDLMTTKDRLDARRVQVDALREQARSEVQVAQAASQTAQRQRDEVRDTVTAVREELSSMQGRLQMIPGADRPAEERRNVQTQAYARREDARNAFAAFEAEYQPYAALGNPDEQVRILEKAVEDAQQLMLQDQQNHLRTETTLQTKREGGVASRVPVLEAQLVEQQRCLRRELLREQSIQLLYSTIQARLDERNTMLAGPVVPVACEWYRIVTGKQIDALDLDTKAAVAGLRFADCTAEVALDDLSAGAADQLCLLIRLAYAKVLADRSPDEPMPVVLDDVLVHSDEHRRRRMIEIINRVAEQTQVVLLTCDPSPYLGQEWTITSIDSRSALAG